MKIATWNVNSIRIRSQQVFDWLKANPVDVLCLQETKVIDDQFPRSIFEELGYHIYVFGQKSYNGVAIFSQKSMTNIHYGFTPILGENSATDLDDQKRLIAGIIDDIRIISVYVPNGSVVGSDKYQYKLNWLKKLREYLAILLKESPNLCISGDFNIAPDDRDIFDPVACQKSIGVSPAERQELQTIIDLGLADAFRKFTPEGGHYSWWDYRGGGFPRNHGWRIDLHYLSLPLYQRAISCKIDKEPRQLIQPSDHVPVIVEI